MRVTERDLLVRKDRLLHTAYDLFCRNGIDAVTLSQIAKSASVSLNSIYRYFDSKATLVRHTQRILWQEITAQLLEDGRERLSAAGSGWEETAILLSERSDFVLRYTLEGLKNRGTPQVLSAIVP